MLNPIYNYNLNASNKYVLKLTPAVVFMSNNNLFCIDK